MEEKDTVIDTMIDSLITPIYGFACMQRKFNYEEVLKLKMSALVFCFPERAMPAVRPRS